VKSRCVDHDEDVVVRGYGSSGLDCSTDDHLDDSIEHAPTVERLKARDGTEWEERERGSGRGL
jgi:hypothetical protein